MHCEVRPGAALSGAAASSLLRQWRSVVQAPLREVSVGSCAWLAKTSSCA